MAMDHTIRSAALIVTGVMLATGASVLYGIHAQPAGVPDWKCDTPAAGATDINGIESMYCGRMAGYNVRGFVPGWLPGRSCNPVGPGVGDITGCRGSENLIFGTQAGYGESSGAYYQFSTCVGLTACQWLTYGNEVTAFGADAGLSWRGTPIQPIVESTAFGANSQGGNYDPVGHIGCPIDGSSNSSFGYNTMIWLCRGYGNTAIGAHAMTGNASGIGGVFNVASGFQSLGAIKNGDFNTASGPFSGMSCTDCNRNIFAGFFSGRTVTIGNDNILIGNEDRASTLLESASGTVVIGNNCPAGNNANHIFVCDGIGNRRMWFDANGSLTLSAYGTADLIATYNGTIYPLRFEQMPAAKALIDRVKALEDRISALDRQ